MLSVAIIGKDSYIGNSIDKQLTDVGCRVVQVDAVDGQWETFDFKSVDTVIHVAAIVHRKDITDYSVYKEINTDLPFRVAKAAKEAGVKHFVFFSTMAVYGKGRSLKSSCIIPGTPFFPQSDYAKSKLEAERLLKQLEDNNFTLSIIRPPSVYGTGCKGNLFDQYIRIALALPIIPKCETSVLQGMVYIDNLSAAVREIIINKKSGEFHPQDNELLSSCEMLQIIRQAKGRKSIMSRILGTMARIFSKLSIYTKLFGGVYYSEEFKSLENLSCDMITTREGLMKSIQDK